MSTEEHLVRRRPGLLETEVDGELIGLHVDHGTCYGFNATATRIWALIETPQTVGALVDALVADFDIDRPTCEAQLWELLATLRSDGLIELQPASQPA